MIRPTMIPVPQFGLALKVPVGGILGFEGRYAAELLVQKLRRSSP